MTGEDSIRLQNEGAWCTSLKHLSTRITTINSKKKTHQKLNFRLIFDSFDNPKSSNITPSLQTTANVFDPLSSTRSPSWPTWDSTNIPLLKHDFIYKKNIKITM